MWPCNIIKKFAKKVFSILFFFFFSKTDAPFLIDQNHQIHTHNILKIHFPIIYISDDSIFMIRWWILNNYIPFILLHNMYLLRYCMFSIFAKVDVSNGWNLAWRYYWMKKKWSTKMIINIVNCFRLL